MCRVVAIEIAPLSPAVRHASAYARLGKGQRSVAVAAAPLTFNARDTIREYSSSFFAAVVAYTGGKSKSTCNASRHYSTAVKGLRKLLQRRVCTFMETATAMHKKALLLQRPEKQRINPLQMKKKKTIGSLW